MLPYRKLRSFGVLFFVAVSVLALSGCVPTTWLPDSSGFIYVKPTKGKNPGDATSGQLLHYDLKTKVSHVVVKDIGPGTMWPAVSGDGKRIATSKFKSGNDKGKSVQFVLYDMQGKQVKQSKEFAWASSKKGGMPFSSAGMLFWSPKADIIVVTDLSATAIYNISADSLKLLEGTVPAIHGGTPFRPDGLGFLAIIDDSEKTKQGRLSLIDWTGAEQKIDTSAFDKIMNVASKGNPKKDAGGPFVLSLLFPSGWTGNTAWVGFRRDKLTWQIDTVKKVASISEKFAGMIAADIKGEPLRYDFPGDVSVLVTEFSEQSQDKKGSKKLTRVEIVNHKTGKKETVVARGPGAALFSPSPDGNYVNIGLGEVFAQEASPMQILVISSKGEVHSKLVVDPTQ